MDWKKVVKEIEIKEEMKEELLQQCKKKKHVPNILFRYSKAAAVAAGLVVCSLGSITVYAAVNAYQARLEAMDKEEVTDYYELAQTGVGEGDSWSRKLTEGERNRLKELRTAMESGERFPEGEISTEGTEGDFYYEADVRKFHLPEEELTDEELLQILDLWAKEDYSLQKRNEELGITPAQAEETPKPELLEYTEENFEYVRAKEIIEGLYDVDTTDMETEIFYGESSSVPESEGSYFITFKTGKEETYQVQLRVYGGEISRVPAGVRHIGGTKKDNTAVTAPDMEKVRRIYEKAKEMVSKVMGVEQPVTAGHCYYNEEHPQVLDVLIEADNGDRYRMTFRTDSEELCEELTFEKEPYGDIELLDMEDVVIDMEN